jgi:hypothetical protein
MNESELRRAYAALLDERRAIADPPGVALEDILAAVEGRGSEAQRVATLDAALSHPRSARELELLRAIAAPQQPARKAVRWNSPLLLAAAAMAIIAVPVAREVLREDAVEPVRSFASDAVLIEPPEEATTEASRTFRWHAVPGARAYGLEILTSAGTLVFTTRTTDTSVTLPPDVPLVPDVEHRWWVVSEFADGTRRQSAFRRLTVAAPR